MTARNYILSVLIILFTFGIARSLIVSNLTDDSKTNIQVVKSAAQSIFPLNKTLRDLAVAQAILESNLYGKPSKLARQHNNLFGIKGKGTKGSVNMSTKEFISGSMTTLKDGFAANGSVEESFEQYKNLIDKPRYAKVKAASSFEDAAKEIRSAGYATDPNYTKMLINIYNKYLK